MCRSRYLESVSIQGPVLNLLQAVRLQPQSSPKYVFPAPNSNWTEITNSVQCTHTDWSVTTSTWRLSIWEIVEMPLYGLTCGCFPLKMQELCQDISLQGKYCPPLTDEKTESQKGQVTCLRSHT